MTTSTPVKTADSALNIYSIDRELVEKCVSEADPLLAHRPQIVVYGRVCHQNRSVGFFSDASAGYKYSNQTAKSTPLTPALQALLQHINDKFHSDFNGILVNKYQNGEESIGKHSDDEKELDAAVGVVAVSYGAVRKFRIRDKKTGEIVADVPTESCTIMQMCGDFQKEFTHEIPVEKRVKEARYSFTFRKHMM